MGQCLVSILSYNTNSKFLLKGSWALKLFHSSLPKMTYYSFFLWIIRKYLKLQFFHELLIQTALVEIWFVFIHFTTVCIFWQSYLVEFDNTIITFSISQHGNVWEMIIPCSIMHLTHCSETCLCFMTHVACFYLCAYWTVQRIIVFITLLIN